jgi:hypothetical protein
MPVVSEFFGIKIYMYWDDHMPPHFHAEYAGLTALIDIRNAVVFRGMLPFRQLKLVLAWCELHESELMKNWEAVQRHENLISIEPLD